MFEEIKFCQIREIAKVILLSFIYFFTFFSTGFCQQSKFAFRHLTVSDGLSKSSVISITQDQQGFMWFGTRDGLNRYDGHKIKVYRHDNTIPNSISNNDITKVMVDSRGDLWVGTFNGLNKYDYSQDKFITFHKESGDSTSLFDNVVRALFESGNGDLWIGTSKGLNRFNRNTGTFEAFFHDDQDSFSISSNHVQDIFEDKEGFLWIATTEGLNKVDISSKGNIRFTRFLHEPGNSNSLSDNNIQSIGEDKEGNLWIGTSLGGLNKYNKSTGKFEFFLLDSLPNDSFRNNDIRSLTVDEQGRLWIGAYNGLYLLDIRNNRLHRMFHDKDNSTSLSNNSVKSVFVDRAGIVWVGTYYGGVNMLDEHNHNFQNYIYQSGLSGLKYEVVSAIVEDAEGMIYVSTEGGGINVLDPRSGVYKTMIKQETGNSLSSNNIKSLYLDDENNLLIGTYRGGLNILDLRSGKVKNYRNEKKNESSLANNSVYSILQENDSLFWLGLFGGGLSLFNKNNEKFFHISAGSDKGLTSGQVRVLFKDSKGNLWVGAHSGLNFLSVENLASSNFQFKTYFYDSKKGSGEAIYTIYEDSMSNIWVGTKESGLNKFDPASDKFVNYKINNNTGIGNEVVNGILEDEKGWLWISTNQGIVKYKPGGSFIKHFGESDGLLSNEFNIHSCHKGRDGFMYFGSLKGLTTFHPDSISTNRSAPSVVLTDFKLFGQSLKPQEEGGILEKTISYTREITLDYDQANFSIEFSIPNFINPQKNHYAYRLKGLEEKWNYTSNYFASYILQNPGTYLFEVKGANNDGIWNSEPTTLKIKVNPAPWRTWWAFLFYAIAVCIALYLLVNIIIYSSRLKHELEIEQLNKQKQESLNQSKLQFFTNVSHEFRTPLTLILGPLEEIIRNYKGNHALYMDLQAIEKNASRLLSLVDQLMDLRKFENKHLQLKVSEGNIVRFVKEIYLSFKQYAKMHNFSYEFVSEEEELLVWYDRDKMERVVFNLISNAFKYTSGGGRIKVLVRQVTGGVEIKVVDSGVGIAPEHLEKIFERFYEVSNCESLLSTKFNKGTGIGLALAKGIIDMHSGEIKVESTENEGSTFTIQLPLGTEHLGENHIIKNFKKNDELTSVEVKNYLPDTHSDLDVPVESSKNAPKILVVEDNDEVRKYIVQIFRGEYNILEAANGKEGLKEALRHVPDMIISDVMMPQTDGIEFCSQIKSDIRTSHIPFVMLTARTSLIFKYEGLEMGADDYIQKPFKVKELKIKVKNLIQSRKKLKEKFSSESLLNPAEVTVSSLDEKLLEKALQIVEENISNELFDISTFSEELGISRTMLFAKTKAWANLTPNDFITVMRMKRAAQLLEQRKLTVSQVAFQVGYKNPKYFSKCFQRHFSENPTSYTKKFSSSAEEVDL
jgi:ligand-binding sensor domain-containing protein/signal transduction histidine kinase/DNA-binding response OmpR family regulator